MGGTGVFKKMLTRFIPRIIPLGSLGGAKNIAISPEHSRLHNAIPYFFTTIEVHLRIKIKLLRIIKRKLLPIEDFI